MNHHEKFSSSSAILISSFIRIICSSKPKDNKDRTKLFEPQEEVDHSRHHNHNPDDDVSGRDADGLRMQGQKVQTL